MKCLLRKWSQWKCGCVKGSIDIFRLTFSVWFYGWKFPAIKTNSQIGFCVILYQLWCLWTVNKAVDLKYTIFQQMDGLAFNDQIRKNIKGFILDRRRKTKKCLLPLSGNYKRKTDSWKTVIWHKHVSERHSFGIREYPENIITCFLLYPFRLIIEHSIFETKLCDANKQHVNLSKLHVRLIWPLFTWETSQTVTYQFECMQKRRQWVNNCYNRTFIGVSIWASVAANTNKVLHT